MTRISVVGSTDSVQQGLTAILEATGADEVMLTGQIYDHEPRLRSFEIMADVREALNGVRVKEVAAGELSPC